MKAHTISLPLAAALLALGAGCSTGPEYSQYPSGTASYPSTPPPASSDRNQTARGAVAGAATGAVLGGIIGNNSEHGNTEKGAAIGAVAGGLAGAAIGHRADQREASASAPVYSSADTSYTVQQIPPAPVSEPQESIPPQPASNAVWIRGHYAYTGTGYQWQPGRWEIPPPGARSWIGPSWQQAGNGGYVYVRGHWQ
jgi:hypothetical protein